MAIKSKLPLFLLYSLVFHAVLFLVLALVRLRSDMTPLFTEVTLVGLTPKGNYGTVAGPAAPGAKKTAAKKSVSSRRDEISLARKRMAEKIKKSIAENPIGVETKDDTDPGLINENAGNTYGVPQGASISGPIAQRKIARSITPEYPDWAKKQGIESSVTLNVGVLASGMVDSFIRITKTSGYKELDQIAIQAMMQWGFEPLSPYVNQDEQWGTITFYFKLK